MEVKARIYQKRDGRWRYLCEVSGDLDHNAGRGDDAGYISFALSVARTFPDHEIVVQDPDHAKLQYAWRSKRVIGFPDPGVQKARVRESLKKEAEQRANREIANDPDAPVKRRLGALVALTFV